MIYLALFLLCSAFLVMQSIGLMIAFVKFAQMTDSQRAYTVLELRYGWQILAAICYIVAYLVK